MGSRQQHADRLLPYETTRYRRRSRTWLTEAMPQGERARVKRLMRAEHLMYTDLTRLGLS